MNTITDEMAVAWLRQKVREEIQNSKEQGIDVPEVNEDDIQLIASRLHENLLGADVFNMIRDVLDLDVEPAGF